MQKDEMSLAMLLSMFESDLLPWKEGGMPLYVDVLQDMNVYSANPNFNNFCYYCEALSYGRFMPLYTSKLGQN